MLTEIATPDLTKEYPRSPAMDLGGFVLLARAIDKCRATLAGTNGEYMYNCPLDQRFFEFTGLDSEKMKELIAGGASDEEVVEWVRKNSSRTEDEVLAWSYEQKSRGPETAEQKSHFEKMRREAAPDRPYIRTWMELLDAEEGRL